MIQIRYEEIINRTIANHSITNIRMTTRTRTDVLLLAGFCAFLFFYASGRFGLIGADEPRYAQVAREMLDHRDWITPTLNGRPWLEKPPLYYWQATLAYSAFGVNDVAARIPSALDATLLVVAIYLFFRRFRHGVEVDAALIAASCAGVVGYAHAASTDVVLASTFAIGMLSWWAWREADKRIYLALFYFFMALGMLAKGPVAPFLAAIVIFLFAAAARDWRLIIRSLWFPGALLFCVVALPWYLAVEMRNPQFFHEFILQQNFARFSTNLYHHPEPFWYFLPVVLLALMPWTIFVIAAFAQSARVWWAETNSFRKRHDPEPSGFAGGAKDASTHASSRSPALLPAGPGISRASAPDAAGARPDLELQLNVFACLWLIIPVIFFSLSQSKLPGYILPAVPAGAVLLAEYLRRYDLETRIAKWMAALHGVVAAAPIVPAALIAYIVTEHHLPGGRPLYIALAVAVVLAAAIALTLMSRFGLRMLRFVTLIPVVLAVAAVVKLGTTAIDQTLSARPLAAELAAIETQKLPVAVCGASRELEYGLAFYRNQKISRYELGETPAEEHLLVANPTWKVAIADHTAGRRISFLGHYPPQNVDYYWVAAKP